MIWLSWRQARNSAWIAALAAAFVVVVWAVTGPELRTAHLDVNRFHVVQVLNTALVAVPALIGGFWGAPLVARELETGTWRLAWTQSVTRTRWFATKVAVVGLLGLAVATVLTIGVNWWASPLDTVNANRFSAGQFGQRGIVPIAYTAFAFALGVGLGAVLRRTVPAMAATLAVFTTVRVAVTLWVRPHFASPLVTSVPLQLPPDGGRVGDSSVTDSGAWVLSQHILDGAGRDTHGQVRIDGSCSASRAAADNCLAAMREVLTVQPGNRFWTFQWIETGLFVALAVALLGASFWWVRTHLR